MEITKKTQDVIVEAFDNFQYANREARIPDLIHNHVERIARTGDPVIEWPRLKPVIKRYFEIIIDEYQKKKTSLHDSNKWEPNVEEFNLEKSRMDMLDLLESFNDAPFTIQRICELLISPTRYYERCDKFMRGFEKNLRVISSYELPNSGEHDNISKANIFKIPIITNKLEEPPATQANVAEPSTSTDPDSHEDYVMAEEKLSTSSDEHQSNSKLDNTETHSQQTQMETREASDAATNPKDELADKVEQDCQRNNPTKDQPDVAMVLDEKNGTTTKDGETEFSSSTSNTPNMPVPVLMDKDTDQ